MGTEHEKLYIFMIIFRWIFLTTRNVSDSCGENHSTNFIFRILFPKIVAFRR